MGFDSFLKGEFDPSFLWGNKKTPTGLVGVFDVFKLIFSAFCSFSSG
jgi:hypothetical protein